MGTAGPGEPAEPRGESASNREGSQQMRNVDTRAVAHAVRAGGSRIAREMAAARAALTRPTSDRDAAIEGAAERVAERIRTRARVHVCARRAATARPYSGV